MFIKVLHKQAFLFLNRFSTVELMPFDYDLFFVNDKPACLWLQNTLRLKPQGSQTPVFNVVFHAYIKCDQK